MTNTNNTFKERAIVKLSAPARIINTIINDHVDTIFKSFDKRIMSKDKLMVSFKDAFIGFQKEDIELLNVFMDSNLYSRLYDENVSQDMTSMMEVYFEMSGSKDYLPALIYDIKHAAWNYESVAPKLRGVIQDLASKNYKSALEKVNADFATIIAAILMTFYIYDRYMNDQEKSKGVVYYIKNYQPEEKPQFGLIPNLNWVKAKKANKEVEKEVELA